MRENLGIERQSDGTYLKKGPWTAEEDEVLMNYVKKYGPRGWSSIRSMGLLPRTGKSCRLRWVNKLRPNLKSGCKFSAEEERVVIYLQAEFGNKWAKIATFLSGRTDNDVKNFWSARRKRMERNLQSQMPKNPKNKGKSPVLDQLPGVSQGSSSSDEEFKMVPLPDLMKQDLITMGIELPILDASSIQMLPDDTFSQSSQPQFGLPAMPPLEMEDLCPEPSDHSFEDMFEHQADPKRGIELSSVELKKNAEGSIKKEDETPDGVFEFPADIFDYLEPFPSSLEWQSVKNWNSVK